MWKVKVKQGYDDMSFKFKEFEEACVFVETSANHIEGEIEFEMRKEGEEDERT